MELSPMEIQCKYYSLSSKRIWSLNHFAAARRKYLRPKGIAKH